MLVILIVLIIILRFVVVSFLSGICFVRIVIIDRLRIVIINIFGNLNVRIIGCVIRIKIVKNVVLIRLLNKDDEKVVVNVWVVCLFLVIGKLLRIVVCEVEDLGIFIKIEVNVFEVGIMVIILIISVRL